MVGTLRRPAQSLVGASKTTSTSVPLAASRSINERSAKSTSGITLFTLPLPGRRNDGTMVSLQGTGQCPKGPSRESDQSLTHRVRHGVRTVPQLQPGGDVVQDVLHGCLL